MKLTMKNVVVLLLLATLVLMLMATSKVNVVSAVSKPTLVRAGECFSFEHELGYEPYDVHVWVDVGSRLSSPYVWTAHTNWPDGAITLSTSQHVSTVCNRSADPFVALISAR